MESGLYIFNICKEINWIMDKEEEKVGRNELCPCGSGKKYKNCCWLEQKSISSKPRNEYKTKNTHLRSKNGGKTWREFPGILQIKLDIKKSSNVNKEIESIFQEIISLVKEKQEKDLYNSILNCKHKLYAVDYHRKVIMKTIEEKVERFKVHPTPPLGVTIETENPILVYETEAFLFQVKSNLDLITKTLGCVLPQLRSYRTFRHSGDNINSEYKAGGKIIKGLQKTGEQDLAEIFDNHRKEWIQQMTIWRDTISHYSGLENFNCFIEEPYLENEATMHYPTMPSGERLDNYCQKTFDNLLSLYQEIFEEIRKIIE